VRVFAAACASFTIDHLLTGQSIIRLIEQSINRTIEQSIKPGDSGFEGKKMKLLARLEKLTLDISVAMFVALIFLTVFQIASRNVYGKSFIQLEEMSIMMLPWFGFISATYVLYKGSHVQIEFVYFKLPVAVRKALFFFTQAAIIVTISIVSYHNWGLVMRQMKLVTPALEWPMGIQDIGFPLCSILMVLPPGYNIYGLFTGKIDEFGKNFIPPSIKEEVL
jgi:TRAP-type C4-dicarboxylate transport system permease small subunit